MFGLPGLTSGHERRASFFFWSETTAADIDTLGFIQIGFWKWFLFVFQGSGVHMIFHR